MYMSLKSIYHKSVEPDPKLTSQFSKQLLRRARMFDVLFPHSLRVLFLR